MEKSALEKFFDLVGFDQKVQSFQNIIAKNKNNRVKLEQKKTELRTQLSVAHDELKNMQKVVSHQELELRDADAMYQKLKHRLDNAHSQKEYTSVTAELAVLDERKNSFETDLLQNWNALELLKKNYEQLKALFEKEQIIIDQEVEKKTEEIKVCEVQIAHHLSLRDEYTQGILPEWLEHYDMIRSRVSDPVVAVVDRANCGGCFYTIPVQDLVRLEKKALLHCRECNRFLYMKK